MKKDYITIFLIYLVYLGYYYFFADDFLNKFLTSSIIVVGVGFGIYFFPEEKMRRKSKFQRVTSFLVFLGIIILLTLAIDYGYPFLKRHFIDLLS
jgi:hypothetical protein